MDRYQRDCADDQKRICPETDAPLDPRQIAILFDSECFKANSDSISNQCQQMITDWRNWVAQHDKPSSEGDDTENVNNDKPSESSDDNDDDDDDDDDDGDKNKGGDDEEEENSGAQGTKFYTACHTDRVNLCPDLADNVSPHEFVSAKCFNHKSLSKSCEKYMEKWVAYRGARMAAFGILISSTICIVGGLLACLTLSCCVACCIRRRRLVLMRRCAQKKAAAKAKAIESEQPLAPVMTESVDPSLVGTDQPIVMVADMENAFPMQTFPAGAAYAPYSYPANWQPVYFAPAQYTPVPTTEQ
jgi:hypothetical protein